MAKKNFTPEDYKKIDSILSDDKYSRYLTQNIEKNFKAMDAFFEELPEKDRGIISLFFKDELKISIYKFMTKLPDMFFSGWPTKSSVVLGPNIESITGDTFSNSSFIKIDMSNASIVDIPAEAFSSLANTKEIILPVEDLESIGDSAFSDCVSLTSITIPESVSSIGEVNIFEGCNPEMAIHANGETFKVKDLEGGEEEGQDE